MVNWPKKEWLEIKRIEKSSLAEENASNESTYKKQREPNLRDTDAAIRLLEDLTRPSWNNAVVLHVGTEI